MEKEIFCWFPFVLYINIFWLRRVGRLEWVDGYRLQICVDG